MSIINNEPLRIVETFIKLFESGYYNLEVQDQYGRWLIYSGLHDSIDEIEEIEAEERRKGIINPDLYHFDEDRIVIKIKRQEEVWYVYWLWRYIGYGHGEVIDSHDGAQVMVLAKNGLEYAHDKVFYDYDKLKEFALKIKAKGVINLEFWTCQGVYEWDDSNSHLEVFEEKSEYDDEPREWSSSDIYNSLGGEDGERKYMSDGAWMDSDGNITFER